MIMVSYRKFRIGGVLLGMALAVSIVVSGATAPARAEKPVKIGFSMALTGGLAGAGKAALVAMEIWRADINKKGGILGRQVEFVYYDDQTNPSTVPGIYSKLLNVDKVDLVVSSYGTNEIAPAMPLVMRKNLVFLGLFGLAVNDKFNYDKYFQIMRPMRSSPATPLPAPAGTPSGPISRSSMTGPIRPGPRTSRPSSGQSTRPSPTWCSSARTRRDRSASSRRRTRSA
jgi:hypothetical protein